MSLLVPKYRVAAGPMISPARLALAPRFADIEQAVASMGTGVVFDHTGGIAAFHERHLPLLDRLATVRAN